MDTEQVIVIVIGIIALLTSIAAIVIVVKRTGNLKEATQVVNARNADLQWQDRTEAMFKELGVANARILKSFEYVMGVAINAALLVDKADAVELLKSVKTLGGKVLDGQPNLSQSTEITGNG